VQYLETTFGDNLRAVERFLYEVFQRLEAPGVLTAGQLQASHEIAARHTA